jgi:hypothetical protein
MPAQLERTGEDQISLTDPDSRARGRGPASARDDSMDARLTCTPPDAVMRFVDAAYLIAGRRYEMPLPCAQSERVPKHSAAPTAHSDLQRQTEIA